MSLPSPAPVPAIMSSLLLGLFMPGQSASVVQLIVAFLHLEGLIQKVCVQPATESRTIRRRLMRDKQRAKQPLFAAMAGLWGVWYLLTTTISTAQRQHGERKRYHAASHPSQAVVLQKVISELGDSTEGDLAAHQSARLQAYRLFNCANSLLSCLNIRAGCWTSSTTIVPRQAESSYKEGQSNKKKREKKEKNKQRRGKDKRNNSNDDGDNQRNESHSDSVGGGSSHTGQRWACPYYKLDPERHKDCVDHRTISQQHHVNQHLSRFHTMKGSHLCPTCGNKFSRMEQWAGHLEGGQNCSPYSGPYELFPDELVGLRTAMGGDEAKWFCRWDSLFYGHPRPESPYVGNNEEEREIRFRHKLTQAFPNGTVYATVEQILQICFSNDVGPNPSPRRIPPVSMPQHQVSAATQFPGTDMLTPALNQTPVLHESSAADVPAGPVIWDVFMGADEAQMW